MPLDFLIFSAVFIGLNIVLNLMITRFQIGDIGLDFLFFAPWLAGTIYGISQGLILAISLTVVHILFHPQVGHWIATAIPSQAVAVILGNALGLSGFWIALVFYFLLNTVILGLLGHMSGRYMAIVLVNSVFSFALFSITPLIGVI